MVIDKIISTFIKTIITSIIMLVMGALIGMSLPNISVIIVVFAFNFICWYIVGLKGN